MKPIICLLVLLSGLASAQNYSGTWSAHVSFTPVICVTETAEAIATVTSNGLLLSDKKDGHITTRTKVNGLTGSGISALGYASGPNYLLVAYEDGNLDLLQNEKIIKLPDLTRKSGLPDKTIHKVICEGNFAYLCCAFGIVKVDLSKQEIAETWYFNIGNGQVAAYDLIPYGGSWYAATGRGIFRGDKQNSNLQDYRNWQLQSALPQPDAIFSSFSLAGGLLFTLDQSNDRLLAFDGKSWLPKYPEIKKIRKIKASATGLIVLTDAGIWLTSLAGNSLINAYQPVNSQVLMDPRDALTDQNGTLWIADHNSGLMHQVAGSFQQLSANAPGSNQITALKAGTEDIFAATVSTNSAGIPEAAISIYQAGIWQNFTAADDAGLKSVRPITAFAPDKSHPDEFWASTAGSGLLLFQKNRVANHYNELNSPLGAINGSCVVNGLTLDSENNLWYTNPTGKVRLGSRSASGIFSTLNYQGMGYSASPTGDVLVSSSAIHWVVLPDEGLFAFKINGITANSSSDPTRKFAVQSRFSNGSTTLITAFSQISSVTEDLNHELWVGTGSGVVVYSNPDKVFDPGDFYATQPSPDDGSGIFKPILEKEKITAVAVDGGNRKWIGTTNSGIFLFTEEGEHLLRHFDSKNSPLLSDQILSLAIAPQNGELFIATDKGLFSCKSDATTGRSDFSKAYVWPNPLRETYEGGVTIDGLAESTDVRITDVAGNLVYKTTSLGGRALWNARNAKGDRVSTGVYLIFCSSGQPKASKIIKLLVIH